MDFRREAATRAAERLIVLPPFAGRTALVNTPELREMRSQTMLFVFGL